MANDPPPDLPLARARAQVARAAGAPAPVVATFFDEATCTATHVVHDPATRAAAIIDSVMDFDAATMRTSFASAQRLVDHCRAEGLHVEWLLETHVHADHLSAAPFLQDALGGRIAIGAGIRAVQAAFGDILNEGAGFARDGSQFDRLFGDGDTFSLGGIPAVALAVPGHTPADMAFVIGDAAFVGDTMFMPDFGTARTDFPGGDARQLFRSIHRLLELPDETRVFLCHDYKSATRDDYAWETTIAAQRGNLHLGEKVDEPAFAAMREARDATLPPPRLMLPAIQVNMRAGRLPAPEANGTSYLKLPLNRV